MTGYYSLPPDPGRNPEGTEANLTDLWSTLFRRWKLLGGVTIVVTAAVMGIILLIPPVFESEGVLRVREEERGAGMLADLLPVGDVPLPGLSGGADVQTEIGVLQSRRIAELVADSVSLHVDLQRPRRGKRTEVLEVLEAGPDAVRGVYSLRRSADGSYALSYDGRETVTAPPPIRIGERFEVGNMTLTLARDLAADPPDEVRFQVRSFQRVVTQLREALQIARQDPGSQLIDISYRHRDPTIAAGVVNGTIAYFMDYSLSSERHESRRKAEILAQQVNRYQIELEAAEQKLQAFQERERVIAPEEQATQQVRRIAEIQARHDALQVERAALAELLDQIATHADAPGAEPPHRQLATFPSFIANEAVQYVLETLTVLQNERAELLGRRTPENADVQILDGRIRELEEQLVSVGANYLQGLDYQIASAAAALDRFERELEAIPAVEVQYAQLVREQQLLSQVYLLLQGRLREASVQEAIDDAAVRVIDYGIVSERAAFPRPLISLVLATVLGLMAGVFTVVGLETAKPSVRSRRDIERAALGIPVVGTIPPMRNGRSLHRILPDRVSALPIGNGARRDLDPLITRSDPWHPASEAYRALTTSLFGNDPAAPGLVVVTSALPEQGKSRLAANLAITLARGGVRTLLMDGDLRTRELAGMFAVPADPGWAEVVLANVPFEDCVREVPAGGTHGAVLQLLPAGNPEIHPAEVIGSPAVRTLLEALAQNYEAVVIDTPSLQPFHDAAMLAGFADSTLLVVRSGATVREALEHATRLLGRAKAQLSGVVLTDYDSAIPTSGFLRRV